MRTMTPSTAAAFKSLHAAGFAPAALDVKTKELIALACGISRLCEGCIIHHARAAKAAGASVAEIHDPVVRLDLLIEVFAPEGDDWQYQVWLDVWSAAARHPALQRVSQKANAKWQRLMGDVFREGTAQGIFQCAGPDASAWRLLALLDSMALQTVAHQSEIPRATMHEWVRASARAEAGLPPRTPWVRPES